MRGDYGTHDKLGLRSLMGMELYRMGRTGRLGLRLGLGLGRYVSRLVLLMVV